MSGAVLVSSMSSVKTFCVRTIQILVDKSIGSSTGWPFPDRPSIRSCAIRLCAIQSRRANPTLARFIETAGTLLRRWRFNGPSVHPRDARTTITPASGPDALAGSFSGVGGCAMNDIEITTQYRQQAEELRTLAAYMLRVAADYDRLASSASMLAGSQSVFAEARNTAGPS